MKIETRLKGIVYTVLIDGEKTDITITTRGSAGKADNLTCSLLDVPSANSFSEMCENIEEALTKQTEENNEK